MKFGSKPSVIPSLSEEDLAIDRIEGVTHELLVHLDETLNLGTGFHRVSYDAYYPESADRIYHSNGCTVHLSSTLYDPRSAVDGSESSSLTRGIFGKRSRISKVRRAIDFHLGSFDQEV